MSPFLFGCTSHSIFQGQKGCKVGEVVLNLFPFPTIPDGRFSLPPFAACPCGWYGANCLQRCLCHGQATCDPVSGQCQCPQGWTGTACELGESHHLLHPSSTSASHSERKVSCAGVWFETTQRKKEAKGWKTPGGDELNWGCSVRNEKAEGRHSIGTRTYNISMVLETCWAEEKNKLFFVPWELGR